MDKINELLLKQNPNIACVMYESCNFGLLFSLRRILDNAGLSHYFDMMKSSVVKGNFDVMYLDSRVIGEDKKREKAAKQLTELRELCNKNKLAGKPLSWILSECQYS